MDRPFFSELICTCLLFFFATVAEAQNKMERENNVVRVDPSSWCAIDGQGNVIDPETAIYPDITERNNKFVGIFYFIFNIYYCIF